MKESYRPTTAIGGQFIECGFLETKGWLHVAPYSLLTEKVGDVIGAERAGV